MLQTVLAMISETAGCSVCFELRVSLAVLLNWVLVKGITLSYHNKETILSTIGPYYGNLKYSL